jgi:predicted DNA-binding transcriptional regulator AlpA
MHRWNISEVTFWRYRKKGYVPAPDVKIGPHAAWYRQTILAAERGDAAAS